MPSSTSPNMVLFLPVPGSTAGPQWASETTSNWSTVDTHDHTAGKGVQIPIAALNVNADFSWLTFGQTNIGYAAFTDKLATGNLTVNQSLGNVAGDPYWRNASGVVKKLSLAGDAITLPNGTAALGSLLFTAIAAPGSPAAGFGSLYFDSTATNIAVKNSAGVVKHGVQTKAAVASNWLTSIADDGSSVLAQPAFTDISGSIAIGQIANSLITYAKIQNVSATNTILGRKSAGAGAVEELLNSGTTAGRVFLPVLIGQSALAAVTSFTSTAWTAGAYRELIIYFRGQASALTFLGLRANNDSGLNYLDMGIIENSGAVGQVSDPVGTDGYARIGVVTTASTKWQVEAHFFPLTDGLERMGWSVSGAFGNGTLAGSYKRDVSFGWSNTATDITFITLISSTGATMTGTVEVWGVPA
jgi:hypothetical protein